MSGNNLKEGLEGLSRIEGISDILFTAMYWLAVIFVILFVSYLFAALTCYLKRKRRGGKNLDSDDFLED